jgi:hypothetical protein
MAAPSHQFGAARPIELLSRLAEPVMFDLQVCVCVSSLYERLKLQPSVWRWAIANGIVWVFVGSANCWAMTEPLASSASSQDMIAVQTSVPLMLAEPKLAEPINSVAVLSDRQRHPATPNTPSTSSDLISMGPDNYNPELQLPLPQPPKLRPPANDREPSVAGLQSLQTDFRNDEDTFGQQNRIIEETAQFGLRNGDKIRFKTGFDFFKQRGVESVNNVPIQVGWEHKLTSTTTLKVAAGVDVFDRLPVAPNLDVELQSQVTPGVTLFGVLEEGPYKFNAQTLDNQISAWRFGPNIYWQIDRNTSFFSLLRLGSYSDGNVEEQSFSRLERKIGQFSLALNVFNWVYRKDLESRSGYFSPPDFLVYNGEIGWEGDVFKFLRCHLSATLGQQRLKGKVDPASGYQARCTVKISPSVEADLGYASSNVQSRNVGDDNYRSNSITGQLRIKF